ncbi:MAG: type VI secretion system baseplate subunit TssK [Acetobacteraceae bacterium]
MPTLADSGNIHPEALYRILLQMAGEFATFTDAPPPPQHLRGLSSLRPAAQPGAP